MKAAHLVGTPSLVSQTFKNKIAKELETTEAISRALDDMAYPISSANPKENAGTADDGNC